MIAFAESTTCRMAALVQHFGDTTDKLTTCGLCDICNPNGNGAAQPAHQPSQQERTWLRAILSALDTPQHLHRQTLHRPRPHERPQRLRHPPRRPRPRRPHHPHQRHLPHPRRQGHHLQKSRHHPRRPHPRRRHARHRLAPHHHLRIHPQEKDRHQIPHRLHQTASDCHRRSSSQPRRRSDSSNNSATGAPKPPAPPKPQPS